MSKNNNVGSLSHSTTVVTRFLSLWAGVLLAMLSLGVTPPAQAKLGPISIGSVYATDENFNNKVVFMPGDRINYHVDVDNNTGSEIPIDVRFQAFLTIPFDPNLYSYDQTVHLDKMPVGLSRFYNPTSLPGSDNILTPSDYITRISVTPSNSANPDGDGDWGEDNFTVQTTKAPAGKAPNLILKLQILRRTHVIYGLVVAMVGFSLSGRGQGQGK